MNLGRRGETGNKRKWHTDEITSGLGNDRVVDTHEESRRKPGAASMRTDTSEWMPTALWCVKTMLCGQLAEEGYSHVQDETHISERLEGTEVLDGEQRVVEERDATEQSGSQQDASQHLGRREGRGGMVRTETMQPELRNILHPPSGMCSYCQICRFQGKHNMRVVMSRRK